MLQVDVCPFASDALEDAMRLAQTKALNSYTFSDCLNHLNYVWSDIYSQICTIDSGYYSRTVKLTKKLTHIPRYVKNTVLVYTAQSPQDYNHIPLRSSGVTDLLGPMTYHISGTDLYCPDATTRPIWVEYCPQPAQIFFTHHNRDPKLYDDPVNVTRSSIYGLYKLYGDNGIDISDSIVTAEEISQSGSWVLRHRANNGNELDITEYLLKGMEDGCQWQLMYITCDFPYIFCSYKHNITGEWRSGFLDSNNEWTDYNPFAYTGRPSNVEYVKCKWNDKTGMGVVIRDHSDLDEDDTPRYKELGWTPDTKLVYPAPEVYRYLVARLAEKFASLNESSIMGVQSELADARFAFQAFLKKDKSAWQRIHNVNPGTLGDWL